MPSQGQPAWDCVFGFQRVRRVLALPVARFLKNTARNHQQKWRSTHRSWGKDAKYRRLKRDADGDAVKIIDSQLLVVKKRLASNTLWPPNLDEIVNKASGLSPLPPPDEITGDEIVFFVPPGPRRCRGLAVGRLLRVVAAGRFVAIHRGRMKVKLLKDIYVVPSPYVWISS